MAILGDFQGLTWVTRGGRGVKKLENWGDVIYGWSLIVVAANSGVSTVFATYFKFLPPFFKIKALLPSFLPPKWCFVGKSGIPI